MGIEKLGEEIFATTTEIKELNQIFDNKLSDLINNLDSLITKYNKNVAMHYTAMLEDPAFSSTYQEFVGLTDAVNSKYDKIEKSLKEIRLEAGSSSPFFQHINNDYAVAKLNVVSMNKMVEKINSISVLVNEVKGAN